MSWDPIKLRIHKHLKIGCFRQLAIPNFPVPEKPDLGQSVEVYLVYIKQDRHISTTAFILTFSITVSYWQVHG